MTPRIVLSGPGIEYGVIVGIVAGVERFWNDRDKSRDQNSTSPRADFHVVRSGASALIPLYIDGSGRRAQNGGSRFFYFGLKRSAEAPRGRRLQSNIWCFGGLRRIESTRNAIPGSSSIDSIDHKNDDALARRISIFTSKTMNFLCFYEQKDPQSTNMCR